MIFEAASERGFGKVGAAFALACLALALIVIVFCSSAAAIRAGITYASE